ncbi:MAG: hypothetical protein HS111_17285 [Kofleriaceae bacterium]|nr:hypothetical protein [Kofleriaceae bacterium]MCL4223076.1 hypothetical protein [Myxococcales bacterium]
MRKLLPVLVGVVVATSACARDVHTRFPASPEAPTGTVELVFTGPAAGVSVAVNGVLVVHDRRTERVRIEHVPTGYADLAIAAGAGEKQVRVWVDSERVTTIPLGAPGEPPVSAIRALATSLASVALYALLN